MTDYRNFLAKLHKNLNILRLREARYGGNSPLELVNQIEDHKQAIALTRQALQGELSQAEWQEELEPLLVSIQTVPPVPLLEQVWVTVKFYLWAQFLSLELSLVGLVEGLSGVFDISPCPRRLLLTGLTLLGGIIVLAFSLLPRYRDRHLVWDRWLTGLLIVMAMTPLVWLTSQGCISANQCPTVELFMSPELIRPGETLKLTAQAKDPENDALVYYWEATQPGLENEGGPYKSPQNTYTAPPDSWGDEIAVTVIVDDRHCERNIKISRNSVVVMVLPPPEPTHTPTSTLTPTPSPTSTATPTPSPTIPTPPSCAEPPPAIEGTAIAGQVQLTQPTGDCVEVGQNETFHITWSEVPDGPYTLWGLVYSPIADRYFPHECGEITPPGGEMDCNVRFESLNQPYEVVFILADQTATATLRETLKGVKRTDLPGGIAQKASLSIIHTK